jgi:hypothetical protein
MEISKFRRPHTCQKSFYFAMSSSYWLRFNCWGNVDNYEKKAKYECCNDLGQKILKRLFGTHVL